MANITTNIVNTTISPADETTLTTTQAALMALLQPYFVTLTTDERAALFSLKEENLVFSFHALEQAQALALLQDLTSQVPGMVYQYLRRPDGSACFPFASEGIRDIYRLSPQDVSASATRVIERIHPDDRARVVQTLQTSLQTLTLWKQDYRVLRQEPRG